MLRLITLTAAVLLTASEAFAAEPPKKLLLIGSAADNHPPGTHEYLPAMEEIAKLLKSAPGVETTVVKADPAWKDGPELIGRADAVVLFLTEGAAWLSADEARLKAFQKLAVRGGGFTVIHWGMGTRDEKNIEAFANLFGGCHGGPDRKFKVVDAEVNVVDAKHPITAGLKDFTVHEEFYYALKQPRAGGVKPLLHAVIEGKPEMVSWAWERPDGGRSFGFTGLHFHENWKRDDYRRLMAQGILWTAKVPASK